MSTSTAVEAEHLELHPDVLPQHMRPEQREYINHTVSAFRHLQALLRGEALTPDSVVALYETLGLVNTFIAARNDSTPHHESARCGPALMTWQEELTHISTDHNFFADTGARVIPYFLCQYAAALGIKPQDIEDLAQLYGLPPLVNTPKPDEYFPQYTEPAQLEYLGLVNDTFMLIATHPMSLPLTPAQRTLLEAHIDALARSMETHKRRNAGAFLQHHLRVIDARVHLTEWPQYGEELFMHLECHLAEWSVALGMNQDVIHTIAYIHGLPSIIEEQPPLYVSDIRRLQREHTNPTQINYLSDVQAILTLIDNAKRDPAQHTTYREVATVLATMQRHFAPEVLRGTAGEKTYALNALEEWQITLAALTSTTHFTDLWAPLVLSMVASNAHVLGITYDVLWGMFEEHGFVPAATDSDES